MPRTATTGTHSALSTRRGWELFVLLRRELEGPVTAVERVAHRDTADARSEFWFEALARRGAPQVHCRDAACELSPVFEQARETQGACTGFALVGAGPDGEPVRCEFTSACLPTHARAARRLAPEQLRPGGTYYYELRAEFAREHTIESERAGAAQLVVLEQSEPEPFAVCRTPLAPLLAEAGVEPGVEPGNAGSERDYPVFYTRAAYARAEQVARRGAHYDPPVETGGLLVGPLCSCPDTGELFAVVTDVLEAEHADQSTHSLTFSAATWEQLESQLTALQQQPATGRHRILGQVHGHSFLPFEGAAPCEACATREVCTRSSAFLSEADVAFCKSLFPAQPWQLSHVFGLDARGRGVEAFYGQSGGELMPRDYRLIDRFEPLPESLPGSLTESSPAPSSQP